MSQTSDKYTDDMYKMFLAHHPDIKNAYTKEEWIKEQEEIDEMLKANPDGGKSPSRLQGFEGWPSIGDDIISKIANIIDGEKTVPDTPKKKTARIRKFDRDNHGGRSKTVRRELF